MVLSIVFGPGSAIVPDAARDGLRTIAAALTDDPGLRLKLLAYAAKEDQSEVFARRLSLSRSLAVRNFLISSNIEESRITVQALGTQGGDEHPDRVDAYYVRR